MKILQFRGKYPNFGDELNTWLWPKLLPNFFDEDEETLFIGIGSTIGDPEKHTKRVIVCGAGYVPDYHRKPDMAHAEWDIRFVRGPRTAARLGLDPELALGDSGILVRTLIDPGKEAADAGMVSFMPHWESLERGNWERACASANIHLIDPRKPVVKVMEEILASRLIIAEAMHGAIVADAFRIPWVPVVPLNIAHRDKWYDWAESLDITLTPRRLWPSTLTEFSVKGLRSSSQGRGDAMLHAAPAATDEAAPAARSLASSLKHGLLETPLAAHFNNYFADMAAYRLTQLSQVTPMLSSDAKIARVTARMQEKIAHMKRDYSKRTAKLTAALMVLCAQALQFLNDTPMQGSA